MRNPIILLSAAVLFIAAALVIVLYLFYYRSKINRRLTDPTHTKKTKLWSPMWVCLTAVIGALTVFAVICMLLASSRPALPSAPSPVAYHAQILSPEEMKDGYLSRYSIEENAGYTKEEKVINDVKYTYFISTEETDAFHPSFLIYAEYIGEGTPRYHDVDVSFQTFDGQEMSNRMVGGCETNGDTVCIVVGNAFSDTNISCIVDFYDDQREEFSLKKLRQENSPLILSIPVR